jgi:hypothetical protein
MTRDCNICESQNQSVHNLDVWLYNALYFIYIYVPIFSALVAGDPLQDEPLGDIVGNLLAETLPDTYYERCWALLRNLLLSGAMESAGRTLQRSCARLDERGRCDSIAYDFPTQSDCPVLVCCV